VCLYTHTHTHTHIYIYIYIFESLNAKICKQIFTFDPPPAENCCLDATKNAGKVNGVRRMVSSGMLRCVALVRKGVSEELSASFIRVTRIGELGTTLPVTSNQVTWYFFAAFVGC
jgi:hypothetical protein